MENQSIQVESIRVGTNVKAAKEPIFIFAIVSSHEQRGLKAAG